MSYLNAHIGRVELIIPQLTVITHNMKYSLDLLTVMFLALLASSRIAVAAPVGECRFDRPATGRRITNVSYVVKHVPSTAPTMTRSEPKSAVSESTLNACK